MALLFNTDSKSLRALRATTLAAALGLSAFALSACGDKAATSSASSGASEFEVAGDHAIGNPDAKVTIVEYASVVCGHCANWHETVYPELKKNYIDTGKVRFIFREFPTAPESLARTGFLIANCAPETKFFDNISLQFKRQKQVFKAASNGTVREEYVNIAKSAGLSEEAFIECLGNEEENARYDAVVQGGIDAGVMGTPAFFINGVKTKNAPSGKPVYSFETFQEVISPLLGEAVPKADTDSANSETP